MTTADRNYEWNYHYHEFIGKTLDSTDEAPIELKIKAAEYADRMTLKADEPRANTNNARNVTG